jgi:phage baseplate assembly protein W
MSVRWSAIQYADALRRVVEEAPGGSRLAPDRGAVLAALWARAVEDGLAEQVRAELEGGLRRHREAVPRRRRT